MTESEEQHHRDGWKDPTSEQLRGGSVVIESHLRTIPAEFMSGGNASWVVHIDRVHHAGDQAATIPTMLRTIDDLGRGRATSVSANDKGMTKEPMLTRLKSSSRVIRHQLPARVETHVTILWCEYRRIHGDFYSGACLIIRCPEELVKHQ
jgi:hypothetical protein